MVAVIQLAVALGATLGGFIYDTSGYRSTFAVSAATLCAYLADVGVGCRLLDRDAPMRSSVLSSSVTRHCALQVGQ